MEEEGNGLEGVESFWGEKVMKSEILRNGECEPHIWERVQKIRVFCVNHPHLVQMFDNCS